MDKKTLKNKKMNDLVSTTDDKSKQTTLIKLSPGLDNFNHKNKKLPDSATKLTHIGGAKIFNISEITNLIKGYLESNDQFNNIWLRGEISNFTEHRSGHMYFDLKDANSIISCVMFKSAKQHLKFKPEHGMKILGFGNINVYPPHGKYQFIFSDLLPDGLGALHLAFLQLKDKLSKEGLFALEHKKPIPKFPNIIGVVTSPTGAAIRDIIHVATRRYPGVKILLTPCKVQGEDAVPQIVEGIQLLHQIPGVDIIIIGRGGGSLEDLWAFNEELLARAIFQAKIPIISAVGHETDFTISDFIADLRAPTPSAAAELAVPDKREIMQNLMNSVIQMRQFLVTKIENFKLHIKRFEESPVFTRPFERIILYRQNLDILINSVINFINNYQKLKRSSLDNYLGKLSALDPRSILRRGYSMTLKLPERKLVLCADMLEENNNVQVIFKDGAVRCKVEKKIDPNKD